MITAKCPLRISLVGGSTDLQSFLDKYDNGSVVSFASNLYTYISINENKNGKYRINYTKTENVKDPSKIKNDIAREVILYFNLPPMTMIFNSDIPSTGTGLAASSSYMVAAIAAALDFLGHDWSQSEICELAIELERKFNPLTGYQDAYGCGIGGLKRFNFNKYGNVSIQFLRSRILDSLSISLIPTGLKRSSTNILSTIDAEKSLALLDDVENLVRCQNVKEFCNVINTAWENKKKISDSILNDNISKLDEKLKSYCEGTYSARKLLGAGGGGYFLVMCNIDDRLSSKQIDGTVPIKIDNEGVRVYAN